MLCIEGRLVYVYQFSEIKRCVKIVLYLLNVLTGDTFDARVVQNGPDEFRVAFVPFHSGSYKLDVSILDKPLGLHEFQVKPREKPQGITFVYMTSSI